MGVNLWDEKTTLNITVCLSSMRKSYSRRVYLEIFITMKIYPLEEEEQIKLVDYLSILENQWKVLWFCSSPAWQYQKSWRVKAKMKRTWVRPGMPDMMIVFPRNIVFIELKRQKWGKPTDEQKNAVAMINKASDATWWMFPAFISYWFDEAKVIVDRYI